MSMHFTRLVFLDGVLVPTTGVFCAWTDTGVSQCSISLPPSYSAENIMPSTHVHVFHIETGLRSERRQSVEVEGLADNPEALLNREASIATMGERFDPVLDFERGSSNRGAVLSKSVPYHAIHYRFGGEVISTSVSESSTEGATVSLSCRGYEHLLESVQMIQLIRGRGTLSEEERRFFGQQRPVVTGSGRRAFYNGVSDLLERYGYSKGIVILCAAVAARINDMWQNRFQWCRLLAQMTAIDDDESVERLIATRSFRDFVREQFQQNYTISLLNAVQVMLAVPRHRLVAIPTPSYFPLVPQRQPVTVQVGEETVTRRRRSGLTATLYWTGPGIIPIPPEDADVPPKNNGSFYYQEEDGEWYWSYRINDGGEWIFVQEEVETIDLRGGTAEGSFSGNNTQCSFSIPEGVMGGPATYTITMDDNFVLTTRTAEQSDDWIPEMSYSVRVENQGLGREHEPNLDLTVEVTRTPSSTYERRQPVFETVPPGRLEGFYSNRAARLRSYAILPELWWACPPACNVLLPEMVRSVGYTDPGMMNITRMIGKISPGRSGSSRVFVDRFVAPNISDLNEAVEDTEDDPHDAVNLTRSEYISGVRAEIHFFEMLHRLARDDDWERYLRSFIVQNFWSMRIGARTAQVTCRTDIRMVTGTTALIVRGSTSSSRLSDQSAEQRILLARLRTLRRLESRLSRCRSRLRARIAKADALGRYLRALYNVRSFIPDEETLRTTSLTDLRRQVRDNPVADINSSESQALFDQLNQDRREVQSESLGISADSRFITPDPSGLDQIIVEDLLDREAAEILIVGTRILNPFPTDNQLSTWIRELESSVSGFRSCISALDVDLETIANALDATRDLLRNQGIAPEENRSFIGYVSQIQESVQSGGESMIVQLSHVRKVGSDLDWDGVSGDDLENVIAFGPDGYVDEKYSISRIGDEIYKPIFGCGSIADLPLVQEALQETEQEEEQEMFDDEVSGMPPADASDIISQLTNVLPCGNRCGAEDSAGDAEVNDRLTSTFAARAIANEYFRLKENGAGVDSIMEWANELRHRATLTLSDAYRDSPVVWGKSENEPGLLEDLTRDDLEVYGEGSPPRGFFASSFIGPDLDYERVRIHVEPPESSEVIDGILTDNEKDLLRSRLQAVLDFVQSTRDGAFSRSG